MVFLGVLFAAPGVVAASCGGQQQAGDAGADATATSWMGTFVGSFAGGSMSTLTMQLMCASGTLTGIADDAFGHSSIAGTCTATSVVFAKTYTDGPTPGFANVYMGTKNGDTITGTWDDDGGLSGTFTVMLGD